MCVSERRMNNLSQMHVFDLFPWMEGGREGGSGGEIPASGGVSSPESINSPRIIDARSSLSSNFIFIF